MIGRLCLIATSGYAIQFFRVTPLDSQRTCLSPRNFIAITLDSNKLPASIEANLQALAPLKFSEAWKVEVFADGSTGLTFVCKIGGESDCLLHKELPSDLLGHIFAGRAKLKIVPPQGLPFLFMVQQRDAIFPISDEADLTQPTESKYRGRLYYSYSHYRCPVHIKAGWLRDSTTSRRRRDEVTSLTYSIGNLNCQYTSAGPGKPLSFAGKERGPDEPHSHLSGQPQVKFLKVRFNGSKQEPQVLESK